MLKKKLVMAVFSAFFGASLIGAGTSAVFTSSATNEGNTFASGTLTVELDKDSSKGEHYFNVDNMAPGDSEVAYMMVSNTGSLDLRFNLTHSFSGELGKALQVDYYYKNEDYDKDDSDSKEWIKIEGPREIPATKPESFVEIKVVVTLPLETGNEFQGKSDILTLKVEAVQKRNN
jgi:predicted ribosomally synthesized peptide with SipW-like signal peptide